MPVPDDVTDWSDDRARLQATETFILAVIGGYVPKSVWVELGSHLGIEAMASKALEVATQANRRAKAALERLDAARSLIRAREDRIDALTPGVGRD